MSIHLTELRCEYLHQPSGVDQLRPRLSWRSEAAARGARQTAYQVLVASTEAALARDGGDRWDSGVVPSDRHAHVRYGGHALRSRDRCHWKVRAWDANGNVSPWSEPARWTMGLLDAHDWSAQWVGVNEARPPSSRWPTPRYLRKQFEYGQGVARATLYVTALGLYEIRLNGRKVGDHVLSPEWTNYHKRVQYQVYDVTDALRAGANVLAATLANGWYCGGWQHWESELRPIYGDEPFLLAQLEIETSTGQTVRVTTDATWQGTTDGPLRFAGIYEGETYDATRDLRGWDVPGAIDDARFRPVTVATPRVGQLVWQRSEPIRVTEHTQPVAVTEPRPGTYLVDLGQNIAGWCRLRITEPRGTTVTLRHNEVLNPDGTLYVDNLNAGHLSPGERQVVRYTCAGDGEETYEPRFTYQGFRYVEVTGLTRQPTLSTITGCVLHTSFAPAGEFECSEPLLNRLSTNIRWSQRANFMGVPTDCPQRDERCGYTGDANFFMDTAVYNYDVAAFFNKWMVDVCQDSQRADDGFADHAPDYGKGGSQNVGWADAGVTCTYRVFRAYGDTDIVRAHYAAMKRFLAMLERTSLGDTRDPNHVGLGDWLNLGGGASKEVIGTAYFAHCYQLMTEMAAAIGEVDDARTFAARAGRIANAFAEQFIDADGRIRDSSQTGYALAFTMGLVPGALAPLVAKRFADEIERFGGKLATGFIGTPRLLPALHAAGRADLAGKLLLERDVPSWLYPVVHGATTIWERWDGWTTTAGFADSGMNSFNHYAFGSVGEYLFGYVAGIGELEPGYRRVAIRPVVGQGLDWAKATYRSIAGPISVGWQRTAATLTLDVELPSNTSGEVTIPCGSGDRLTEGGDSLDNATFVELLSREADRAVVAIGSGRYAFSVSSAAASS